MSKKAVCLTDMEGEVRWFNEDELSAQLATIDMLPQGAIKTMIVRFVTDVRQMLEEQQAYFKAQHGSSEKTRLLASCKRMETTVRDKCKAIIPTLDKLS